MELKGWRTIVEPRDLRAKPDQCGKFWLRDKLGSQHCLRVCGGCLCRLRVDIPGFNGHRVAVVLLHQGEWATHVEGQASKLAQHPSITTGRQ